MCGYLAVPISSVTNINLSLFNYLGAVDKNGTLDYEHEGLFMGFQFYSIDLHVYPFTNTALF